MNNLLATFSGVIFNPGPTVGRLMEKKQWQAILILLLIASSIFTYITYPVSKVEQAKIVRNSEIASRIPEERLENLDKFTPGQRLTGSLYPIAITGLALVLASFFVYLFFKIGGVEGLYVNYFSAVVNASLIDLFYGGLLRTYLVVAKKSILISFGPTVFFRGLDFRSLSYMILSQFDLFSLWYLAVLILGIVHFGKIPLKKGLSIGILYFLFKATLLVAFSYIFMKITGF